MDVLFKWIVLVLILIDIMRGYDDWRFVFIFSLIIVMLDEFINIILFAEVED